jgi:uncharacterized protein
MNPVMDRRPSAIARRGALTEAETTRKPPHSARVAARRSAPPRWQRHATRAELATFRFAAAVAAIYFLDYAFIDRQPGTSASDHLVSGLVPVGLLGAATFGYSRVRAGARATLALLVGITIGASGIAGPIRHAVISHPSGADFTGMTATAGALVMVTLAVTTLWRCRRWDGTRRRRYLRRLGAAVGAVVGAWLLYPVVLGFIGTHNARAPVPAANFQAAYRTITFRSTDGLRLVGWYVPSRNGAAVIVSPGRSPSVQAHARVLIHHGYGVLVFDRRGEGQSQGEPNLFGWSGDRDLIGAVRFLEHQPDIQHGRIGGLGLSVGGEMLLQTAAETTGLKAVVSEGAGARSVKEALEFPDTASKWTQLVPWFALATATTAVFADRTPPPSLTSLIPRISPRGIFLIWAGHGAGEDVNPRYYEIAGPPKRVWKIAQAGHVGGLSAQPAEYEQRVVGFFDRMLLGRGS